MEGQKFKSKQHLLSLFFTFFFLDSILIEDREDQGQHICHRDFIKGTLFGCKAQTVEDPCHKPWRKSTTAYSQR